MNSLYDAIVVGGGPAGSAAAATLARLGRSVALLEKDHFPRRKVCGAFLSPDALPLLDRLGVREEIAACAEKITRGSLYPPLGGGVPLRLPSPALGVSRYLLDDLLAQKAGAAGAQIRFGARVLSAGRANNLFRVALMTSSGREELEARTVIGAWGRWDALDRALDRGFLGRRRRFLAWSRDFEGDTASLAGRVKLYLFRGGYCGLSRVEGGTVNLAGIVSEKVRAAAGGWEEVLRRARSDNPALDRDLSRLEPGPIGYLGTGPVFFTAKPPVEEDIVMVGDAAGVLDPFSGEGQRTALSSGILAAELVDRALSDRISPQALSAAYAHAWKARFARRFGWSCLFRPLMLHPALASAAGRLMGAGLARLGVRMLQASYRRDTRT